MEKIWKQRKLKKDFSTIQYTLKLNDMFNKDIKRSNWIYRNVNNYHLKVSFVISNLWHIQNNKRCKSWWNLYKHYIESKEKCTTRNNNKHIQYIIKHLYTIFTLYTWNTDIYDRKARVCAINKHMLWYLMCVIFFLNINMFLHFFAKLWILFIECFI